MNATNGTSGNEAVQAQLVEIRAAQIERIANQRRRDNFAEPRKGTFATISEALAHPPETSHVSWISSPVEDGLGQLGKVAVNDRLTPQARGEDWAGIKNATQAQLDERYDSTLAEIETKLADLEVKARRSFSSDLDPAKLGYQVTTLNAQVDSGQLDEFGILQKWQEALDGKDLFLVQVLTDNGEALIRASRPPQQRSYPLPKRHTELMAQSDEALRSPEQKKARADFLTAVPTCGNSDGAVDHGAHALRHGRPRPGTSSASGTDTGLRPRERSRPVAALGRRNADC